MKTVTAKELKELDPKRFEREYYEWQEYGALWDDWFDSIEQNFTDEMAAHGVQVDRIAFSGFYSQGSYASFDGRVNVHKWMAIETYDDGQTYAEAFPALYLAAEQDSSLMLVTTTHRGNTNFNFEAALDNTTPDGIFQHLDEDGWNTLVAQQDDASNLESNIKWFVESKNNELFKQLQDEYEDLTSEESFLNSCEANEVTFELETEDEIHS
jgi:hypothetical protein